MRETTFLLALLAVGGLALVPARAAEPEAPEWEVPDVTQVVVDLATVKDAEPDGPLPPAERFVASLTAGGRLHFGTSERYVAGDGDLGAGALTQSKGAETSRTLRAFSEALRQVLKRPGLRAGDGLARLRLLIRADRRVPWLEAVWILEAAAAPGIGVHRTQFAVRKTDGSANTAWRVPQDLAGGPAGGQVAECAVRLDLDLSEADRPLLRVREGFDAAGTSVRRTLAEFSSHGPAALDGAALAETLHAYRELHGRESGTPALLVTTLRLTRRGARAWTCGDVLPLLATLRELGARVRFEEAPPDLQPRAADLLHEGARGPFASAPVRVTRRALRWEKAIDEALRWLAAHQAPSGAWEAAGFPAWCDGQEAGAQRPEGAGSAEHDVGVTALALLAYLGAGYAPRGEHPYVETVRAGLRYLKGVQDAEGCFGSREGMRWVYDHGAATWALVEAFGLTASPRLAAPAQKGLDFIALCRNPYYAWRYGIKPGDNDTSVSGWMLMPLAVARAVNTDREGRGQAPPLRIDDAAFDGVHTWLEKMTDPDYGRVGYIQRGGSVARPQALIDRYPGDKSEAMTGLGITLRVQIGENPTRNRKILRGLDLLRRLRPTWNPRDGSIDMYYWYWGALAAYQAGGGPWKSWEAALDEAIPPNQRKDTTYCLYRGSWDPIGPWGDTGGRVYATALLALTLETPTRYARRFGR